MDAWIQEKISKCRLPGERLSHRPGKMLADRSKETGNSLPLACQDWAGTKAACRFLDSQASVALKLGSSTSP